MKKRNYFLYLLLLCVITSFGQVLDQKNTSNVGSRNLQGIPLVPATHLNFDGIDDYVTLGTSLNTSLDNSSAITVEAWVKPMLNSGLGVIVGNYDTGVSEMQFLLRRDYDYYSFWLDTGSGFQSVATPVNSVLLNTWQHVVGVWNSTDATMKIYINGVLQGTTTGVVGTTLNTVTNPIFIGNNNINEDFTGDIDELRIWNTVRTPDQIFGSKNCELQGTETGLLAYYKFNQGFDLSNNSTETTLTDATLNANNGTLNNFALNGTISNWLASSPVITGSTIPSAPTVAAQSFCGATTANSLVPAISTTVKWYSSLTSTTALVATDALTSATYYVASVNANGCESDRVSALITVLNPQFYSTIPEVLYYKFDGSGTSVPNLATNPPVGSESATILSGITQGNTGNTGGALIGSGVSSTTDYLNTNWNTNLGTNSWTISFWSSGISTNTTLYYIFGDGTANSFRCFTNGVAGSGNWILRGGGLADVLLPGGALTTPTLCVFVYDNVANNVKAYLNGVLVNTVNQSAGSVNIVGTAPFKVMGYNTTIGAPVGGKLDDFGIFNRALSLTEVQNIYQQVNTNQVFCNPATVANLQPASSSTVKWYSTPTGGTELATTEALVNGTYYVAPVDGTCEGTRVAANIDVILLSNATTQNAGVITATENVSGVSYQWYECPNNLLINEINQTFTPTVNGDYRVEVTKGACMVSSTCETVLNSNSFEIKIGLAIYPNPTNGIFNVSLEEDATVEVHDMLGKVIYTKKVKAGKTTIDIFNYQSGVYLLNVTNENGSVSKKLIKE